MGRLKETRRLGLAWVVAGFLLGPGVACEGEGGEGSGGGNTFIGEGSSTPYDPWSGGRVAQPGASPAHDASSQVPDGRSYVPTNPCATCPRIEADSYDLFGDGNCITWVYWDTDCRDVPKAELQIACGKTGRGCDWTPNVCESFHPCGMVYTQLVGDIYYLRAQPCPIDIDCLATSSEPPHACTQDGHCDTWCPADPTNSGRSIDGDCNPGGTDPQPIDRAAAYCDGGVKYDQC